MRQQARIPRTSDKNALWRFALAVYAEPGVKEECLYFQDRQKGDVCLLLAALFLASGGCSIGPDTLRRLKYSVPWQARLHLFLTRYVRKRLSRDGRTGRLRKALLKRELTMEQTRLARLEAASIDERANLEQDDALRKLIDSLCAFYGLKRIGLSATIAATRKSGGSARHSPHLS
ncbi:TIGR02444 family protein [Paracoccus onubensis]|uniref:TIGR02444 family protein n=1 Tax=Paracoccus onubensis TaxID=1675788 RepID=UPI002730BCA2|nr:TIGR02444 family protein [Paracoccus onubensis]MDP0926610.1 TIGR02444 family protein [Paracoccus onubensis]